ncbi:MAG: hypothetical protein EBS23_00605 [Betaproteobacteria bacterium]|nr:hypothetical protein [Betaproteobacteria bacterium]
MPQPTGSAAATVWRIGDRAIVEGAARFEGTVTALFTLTAADADKLRIKYPWIEAGDLVLVLMDDSGTQRTRIASDPTVRRVITPAAARGEEP